MDKIADHSEIKHHAVKSVKWTALTEIVSRSIQPIITLILARLLTPDDFGLIGVAMIAIGLAQILQDFGLGKTLIQCETDIDKSANVIFWTNLALSFGLYVLIFAGAPLCAIFFHEPRVTVVLRVLCLQLVLLSFISVHQALFTREFRFKKLFFIRSISALAPGFVSIPLAMMGYGVWALVYGFLAGSFIQVIIFWSMSEWRPKFEYDLNLAKKLSGFSSWVVTEALLGWLMVWGDSVVLGYFLGIKDLGVYRLGTTFLALISGLFINPILPIAYSSFSRLRDQVPHLRAYFLKVTQLIAIAALPVCLGIVVLAKPISTIVFGSKWNGIEFVFCIIGIKEIISCIAGGINVETIRALGRPDINVKIHLLTAIFYVPIYIVAAPRGLMVFCFARLLVALGIVVLYVYNTHKVMAVSLLYPFRCAKQPFAAVLVMIAVLFGFMYYVPVNGWMALTGAITVGVISYMTAFWFIDKNMFKATFNYANMILGIKPHSINFIIKNISCVSRKILRGWKPSPDEMVKANTRDAFNSFFREDRFLKKHYLTAERLDFYENIADRCAAIFSVYSATGSLVRICDVGCGMGHTLEALNRKITQKTGSGKVELRGMDFSDSAIEKAKKIVPQAVLSVEDIYSNNLPLNYFDLVLCMETLEHLHDPETALLQLMRICKSGGKIIITVPNGEVDRWDGHVNFWDREQFKVFLSPHGAATIELSNDRNDIIAILEKGGV